MTIEAGDSVKVIDVDNYPRAFGINKGMVGIVRSVFTSKGGHKVANVDFAPLGLMTNESPTHPLSFTRLTFS